MASSCKGLSVQPVNESCYSVIDKDFSPPLHILDQSERELCGKEFYLVFFYIELVYFKEERRKKEEKERKIRKSAKLSFNPL